MSGDVMNILGKSFYHLNAGQTPNNNYLVSSALTSFINAFAGTPAVSGSAKGATATALNNSSATVNGLDALLDSVPTPTQTNVPKAYINWILFDEQFKPVSSGSGFDLVNTNADAVKSHNRSITINKNGYLYVYCSNESNVDVFFDNLQVIHTRGQLLENTNYYPFGLTMSGISSKAAGGLENKRKFNGGSELQHQEFSDLSGLDLYTTNYRLYDPQIGRFHQLDPLADCFEDNSPYAYVHNNPILFNDPLGLGDSLRGRPGEEPARMVDVTVTTTVKRSGTNHSQLLFPPISDERRYADNTLVYHPIVGGLLPSNITNIPSAIANAGFGQPPYPRGTYVRQFRTVRTEVYVRVSNSVKGNVRGQWLVKASSIRGMSPQQIQQNLALNPENGLPNQMGEVTVPAGTLMRAGPVGGNDFGPGNLGITQYQLMEPIPNSNFTNPVSIVTPSIETPIDVPIEPIETPIEFPEIPIIP